MLNIVEKGYSLREYSSYITPFVTRKRFYFIKVKNTFIRNT